MDPIINTSSHCLETSKTDYIECNLDPDEYRRLGAGPGEYNQSDDPEGQGYFQPFVSTVTEAPVKVWTFIMTLLFFVVNPLTQSEAFIQCRRTGKKMKRNLSKSYR